MGKPGDSNEPELLFESYKLIAEDLSRVRQQRNEIMRSYITINSVVLVASAALLRETQFVVTWWQALIIGPLLVAGMTASLQWMLAIQQYTPLVAVRVGRLERLEEAMTYRIPPLFKAETEILDLFSGETKELKRLEDRDDRKLSTLLDRLIRYVDQHRVLPAMFLILYVIAFLISLVLAAGNSISLVLAGGNS